MKQANSLIDLKTLRAGMPGPVGLIPTMGFLHEGHLSLVRAAKQSCASVVVSIFINPIQFGPTEDFNHYPKDLDRDLKLLESENVDLVWIPTSKDMYPSGYQTWVTVEKLTETLEGAYRPGHLRGVTTVVAKLFNAVRPDLAFFGQKDAQQAIVIQQMSVDLNFDLKIIVCPTIREPDGLAMSSRNVYLNAKQRQAATVLYRALSAAGSAFQSGETDAENLRRIMADIIQSEPLAKMQYVSCSDPADLSEISGQFSGRALLSMAVFFGDVRLIDNLIVGGYKNAACS